MSDDQKLAITEPRRFKGKVKAIFQNMFEIITVLFVISSGRAHSSYVSFWISIITYMSIIPTMMKQKVRISVGMILSLFNLVIIGIVILMKVKYAPREDEVNQWTQMGGEHDEISKILEKEKKTTIVDFMSYGYVIN